MSRFSGRSIPSFFRLGADVPIGLPLSFLKLKAMEDDKKFKEIIENLSKDWGRIKTILEDNIRETQRLIEYLDKIIKEKEDKFTKLN
ncbi:MAG: hypothetical protein ABR974_00425 [Bacteroidales bacterium]|jgi:hypothetical protein